MHHLANKLPYNGTTIDPLTTKAEIDGMLHEFRMFDTETKTELARVTGVRWTDIRGP